jgi:hypothetical protein
MQMNNNLKMFTMVCFVAFLGIFLGSAASATTIPITVGCIGSCGTDTTGNGDVLPQAGFTSYTYITTTGGITGGGTIPVGALGDETNGSTLTTGAFAATAGSLLQYNFDYVTSDGSGYPDYAWVELESSTGTPLALLFTATTQPSGTIVPGVGLPTPVATLTPSSVPITPGSGTTCTGAGSGSPGCNSPAGGPVWSELGTWSGTCWAVGCGLTGWIQSDYTIPTAGDYEVAFGVTNVRDELYDSGLAIDGLTIAGTPIPIGTPEPSTITLLGMGLIALIVAARRQKMLTV